MTTVALYARVSTKDKGQSTENQLPELRRFAQAYGYTVYKEYVEHESGGTGKCSEFQALFADAHQRRFDLVLFWSLDRFSREGALPTLQIARLGRRLQITYRAVFRFSGALSRSHHFHFSNAG
jgi:DNA invertase Pin-like site-specific DNA recombinase